MQDVPCPPICFRKGHVNQNAGKRKKVQLAEIQKIFEA